jgi:phosphoenolpyruvate carboxykinase (ATP)
MNDLAKIGITNPGKVYRNLPPAELVEHAVKRAEAVLTDTGALMYDTGKFTGRAPKDRFIVKDSLTSDLVWWGDINQPFEPESFDKLMDKMLAYMNGKDLYVRDAFVAADPDYRMRIKVVGLSASHNLFCSNMFIRPTAEELAQEAEPDFTILSAYSFEADPATDGTRQPNFVIVNFTRRIVLVGGTGYTGETKKSIFSILNFLLPVKHNVLPMHCGANMGAEGDAAVFFGLSGTGKTTLSADPERPLIGDDEHGWSDKGIFNFEGGCYAKVINLSRESEPQIWDAIKFGAILENTRFIPGTRTVDYANVSVTENTRVSYPLHHIANAVEPSVGGMPKIIFFLTCDAYGVLPPISKLSPGQAMYHFISGYTAKVAGTELGITEPTAAFSACFGAPFMPLHPTKYAELLGKKMAEHNVNVWLVNTGWSGGPYGTGKRIKLAYTRAMITAALNGSLDKVAYQLHPFFGVNVPQSCPNVPDEILNPKNTWTDAEAYDAKANFLAGLFAKNFEKFKEMASAEILEGAPLVLS